MTTSPPRVRGRWAARGRHTARVGVVALATAVLAAGCAGLPRSTPVVQGQAVAGAQDAGVRIIPRGPVAGSDADDLVTDFLRQGLGADDDSSVAREYLTPRASSQWQPDGSGWIYDGPEALAVKVTAPGTVVVTGRVSAQLDREGHYSELPPGQTRSLTLRLVKVGDQWRIDGGLDGQHTVWISRADFGLYASYPITYVTPDDTAVTDRRWFLQGPGLVTRLARAQLAPPPTYLQGAVLTGVPEYTDLAHGSVSVEGGTARVVLSSRALNADDRNRRRMWQQVTATLTAVGGVEAVQLEADGARLSVPGLPDRALGAQDVDLRDAEPPTGPVLLRSSAGLERVDPRQLTESRSRKEARADGPPLPDIGPEWYRLASSADGTEIAGLDGDDEELARWREGRMVRVRGFARDLTRPAYDPGGYLWMAGRTDAGTRVLVQPTSDLSGRAPVAINVPWLSDRKVIALRPSPEGQRVLVVSEPSGGGPSTVGVAGVLRRDGRPVGLATPITVGGGSTDVTDATWLDAETIGLVGAVDAKSDQRVVIAPISGPSQVLGAVPNPTSITTFGGSRSIVVTTRRGAALVRSGNGLVPLVSSTSDFVVPGH
ncbi:GerMN domain-containing protein [Arsenicicoccus cauae]|uniref:GerMN domain-containing protein n=1 Tax=Arsenicicoccus cauae TaxID=2663847 RepID=A0A6I3ITM7_9MICO|nr:GerMN domain-containing protein [Arsenicicoccus cauae]MTB73300.1 hypothetical protein [Arsenicicoccus cauae]